VSDMLQVGQRLAADERLTSANGRFTLLMQGDGNLVLYRDAVDVAGAYWATGTESLPPDQRPTTLELRPDAQLVLCDGNQVVRWASGTAGDYVDPRLVLHDNGNLVVHHDGGAPVWASGAADGTGAMAAVGHMESAAPTTTAVDALAARERLNSAVQACGRMPLVVAGEADVEPPSESIVDGGGVSYRVVEQRRRLVNEVVEHAFLQDIGRLGVWPGQVIQGRALLGGDVAPIGPLARQPGTITIVTDLIGGTPGPQTMRIEAPEGGAVDDVRRSLIASLGPSDAPGILHTGFSRASSMREVGVRLGLAVKGSNFAVDANASLNETRRQTTVVASVRQVFYSVRFTPSGAGAPGLFTDAVRPDDLAPYMGPDNPPLYIDSVQYGRLICVTASGSFSSSELRAAVEGSYKSGVDAKVSLDARSREVLESSDVQVYTIGVPGRESFQALSDPVRELEQVYRSGLAFSPGNPGAPVSFTCRHIADGTLAKVGLAAEYVQPLSVQGEDVAGRTFEVFDGVGGGLVDTGITINPGDTVTIGATGQVWSGVIFSGTHGPEGWPGHSADAHAPAPDATAYCLIHRFGNGQWMTTGPFWQGTPDETGHGRLQLNVNDNNPYNGDSSKRWTVTVDVTRAGAESVGIYV
jgi:Thiol-activated cytolysin